MSADLLREAAALMRKRAEAATPGRWKLWGMEVRADVDGTSNLDTSLPVATSYHEAGLRTFNADYIAGVDPVVALAVAKWLNDEALSAGNRDDLVMPAAVAVARAYLRES